MIRYNVTHIVVDVAHIARDHISLAKLNAIGYRVASNGRYIVYEAPPPAALMTVTDCMPSGAASEEMCIAKGCEWVPHFNGPWCQVRAL